MATDLELFPWHRPEGGYEWRDAQVMPQQGMSEEDKQQTRFLLERDVPEQRHWRYFPLIDHPTLFREFAMLEPTENAYSQFASQYGDLGIGLLLRRSGPLTFADPISRWRDEHTKMHRVVEVLTAIGESNVSGLREWFKVSNEGARYEREDGFGASYGWVTIASQLRDYIWEWSQQAASDDDVLVRIAKAWAQQEINDALGNAQRHAMTTARVVLDLDRQRMTLRVVPQSLIGALWLQCARVLTLEPSFRACDHCGKWFELSPDTRRKNSKYCSSRCKVAAYRERKGNSNIYAWLIAYYAQVRSRPDWANLTPSERVRVLREHANTETDGRTERKFQKIDKAERWSRALSELEEQWEAGQP